MYITTEAIVKNVADIWLEIQILHVPTPHSTSVIILHGVLLVYFCIVILHLYCVLIVTILLLLQNQESEKEENGIGY